MQTRRFLAPAHAAVALSLALAVVLVACATPRCVDFEDLVTGTRYSPGDTITSAGETLTLAAFRPSVGASTVNGEALVVEMAGTPLTRAVELRGSELALPLNGAVDNVQVHYQHTGGRASVVLNGFPMPWTGSTNISGSNVGPGGELFVDAFQYAAPSGIPHNWIGTLTVAGPMTSLALGGEELWIDSLCIHDDDCIDEPVDNANLRFATLGNVSVTHERRWLPFHRLGHRTFRLSDVTLENVSAPAGTQVTVEVALHRVNDQVHWIVTTDRTYIATGSPQRLSVPMGNVALAQNTSASDAATSFALMIEVRSVGAPATVETIEPTAFPYCDGTARFAFHRAQVAPQATFAFTTGAAFHVRLLGTCE